MGVVGELQFEVLQYRLEDEYNLETRLQRLSYRVARWPRRDNEPVSDVRGVNTVYRDLNDLPVILVDSEWDLNWLQKENEGMIFGSPFTAGMEL